MYLLCTKYVTYYEGVVVAECHDLTAAINHPPVEKGLVILAPNRLFFHPRSMIHHAAT